LFLTLFCKWQSCGVTIQRTRQSVKDTTAYLLVSPHASLCGAVQFKAFAFAFSHPRVCHHLRFPHRTMWSSVSTYLLDSGIYAVLNFELSKSFIIFALAI
jgi:hypothetical protein